MKPLKIRKMGIFESNPILMYRFRFQLSRSLLFSALITILSKPGSAQPLPDSKETLAIESERYEVSVPLERGLHGGHLQGIQIYNETLMVSGSSKEFGYLAVFQKLGGTFQFIGLKKLATDPLNHAGGFQVAENWLAVGLEDPVGRRESIIQLIDLSGFEKLQQPAVYTLRRKGEYQFSTAGAVALLKRKDHFLLAVGTWDCRTIDFYISNGVDPYADGFVFEKWTTWDSREAIRREWTDKKFGSYQNLQLTEDSASVYITGFCRATNGTDRADVFRMDTDADPYTMVQKVASYSVQCSGSVTFRNGAGFTTYNGRPSIVAVGHDLIPKLEFQVFPIKDE